MTEFELAYDEMLGLTRLLSAIADCGINVDGIVLLMDDPNTFSVKILGVRG